MAKMFYTMEEASAKLGKSEEELKQMANSGQLQQFRDRDKLMFKREQVDQLADGATDEADVEEIRLDQPISQSKTDTDTIDLITETEESAPSKAESPKSATATGISVFEADEVEAADPMAQTHVTNAFTPADDDLTLESIGSGSGLLDLTRESDDTSLGAVELLEDIAPGEASSIGAMMPGSSTGIFDAVGGADSAAAGLGDVEGQGMSLGATPYVVEEAEDPVGDGFGGGMMLGVFAVLMIVMTILVTGMRGEIISMVNKFAAWQQESFGMQYWLMGLACIIFSLVGLFIGKSRVGKAG